MKIFSYNILDGGEGRADPIAEIIEAQQADIVVLIEADNLSVLDRIARRLKMDYAVGANGTRGAAILSRHTISQSVNHAPLLKAGPRSFLSADVCDPAGQRWRVYAIHLSAGATLDDERKRLGEIDAILPVLSAEQMNHQPHLLAGDFNANSPLAEIDLSTLREKSKKAWEQNGRMLPRDVISRLLNLGYVDALAQVDAKNAPRLNTFTTHEPGQRVDYILTHGIELHRIRRAWVEHDRLAKYASDHFPVGAEIV